MSWIQEAHPTVVKAGTEQTQLKNGLKDDHLQSAVDFSRFLDLIDFANSCNSMGVWWIGKWL